MVVRCTPSNKKQTHKVVIVLWLDGRPMLTSVRDSKQTALISFGYDGDIRIIVDAYTDRPIVIEGGVREHDHTRQGRQL